MSNATINTSTTQAAYPYIGAKEIESKRLSILSELYDKNSFSILSKHLSSGMKVLELGSGSGNIAASIAKAVGENGSYYGIECSEDRIQEANDLLVGLNNIQISHGNALELIETLESNSFDVIYFRWFLWTVPEVNRQQFLQTLFKLLKQGGVIIAEEADMLTMSCEPSHPSMSRYIKLTQSRCETGNHSMQLGLSFPELFKQANPTAIHVSTEKFQPTATTTNTKLLPYYCIKSTESSLCDAGATVEELRKIGDELLQVAEDPKYIFNSTANYISVYTK